MVERLFPQAERSSTLGKQRLANPMLQDMTREEFVAEATSGLAAPPRYFAHDAVTNRRGAPGLDELPEDMHEGRVGDAARQMVELAGGEVACAHHFPMQLGDQHRLADPRVARHDEQLGCTLACSVERGEQRPELLLPAVQLLRNAELVREVQLAQRERLDLAS